MARKYAVRAPRTTAGGTRFLRTERNYPLHAYRVLAPLRLHLLSMAELLRAAARELDDERWTRAADAVDAAARMLVELSR